MTQDRHPGEEPTLAGVRFRNAALRRLPMHDAEAVAFLASAALVVLLTVASLLLDGSDLLGASRFNMKVTDALNVLAAFIRGEHHPQYQRLYVLLGCVVAGLAAATLLTLRAVAGWRRMRISIRADVLLCVAVVVVLLLPAHVLFLLPNPGTGELARESARAYRDALTFGWSGVLLFAIPVLAAVSTDHRLRIAALWASLVGVAGTYIAHADVRGSRTENELLIFGVALAAIAWTGTRARRARDEERTLRDQAEDTLEELSDQRRRYEEQTNAAIEQLRHSEEVIARRESSRMSFMASAAHDLRQPLHALAIYIDLLSHALRRAPGDADRAAREGEVQRYLRVVKDENAALAAAFDAILDYSEIESGFRVPDQKPCDLSEVLFDLERRFTPMAQQKGLVLQVMPPRQARYVLTDKALLVRALSNLLSNAVKYTPARAGRHGPAHRPDVLVRVRRRGLQATIYVIDAGCGIPREKQQSIFEPGVQLDNAEGDRRKGHGLGLAIVMSVVRRALPGHDVRLRSMVNRGSHFMLDVPRVLGEIAAQAGDAGDEDSVMPQTVQPARALDGALVVVVEDDPTLLAGLVETLKLQGAFVIEAAGIDDLRRKLDQSDRFPDIVLSDFRLASEATGKDVIECVRAHCMDEAIPAILYTADFATASAAVGAMEDVTVFRKPVRARDLLRHMAERYQPAVSPLDPLGQR